MLFACVSRDVPPPLAAIANEQAWLAGPRREILPLHIPVPLWTGVPGCGYPWHWSIIPWLRERPLIWRRRWMTEAARLGAFLKALHTPAPQKAPTNPVRGVPLQQRAPQIEAAYAEPRKPLSADNP